MLLMPLAQIDAEVRRFPRPDRSKSRVVEPILHDWSEHASQVPFVCYFQSFELQHDLESINEVYRQNMKFQRLLVG
jgi:hypothetical protein